jgi:hypothetical protein
LTQFYRYEFDDGEGIWYSRHEAKEELRDLLNKIGRSLPTPTCERNNDEFYKASYICPKGEFWFTEQGYNKFQDDLDRLSTHPAVRVRIGVNLKVLWLGASQLQILAVPDSGETVVA